MLGLAGEFRGRWITSFLNRVLENPRVDQDLVRNCCGLSHLDDLVFDLLPALCQLIGSHYDWVSSNFVELDLDVLGLNWLGLRKHRRVVVLLQLDVLNNYPSL